MTSRYSPVPGTARCPLCKQMDDDSHVRHPRADIVAWLWKSSAAWKLTIVLVPISLTLLLACLIGTVWNLMGEA